MGIGIPKYRKYREIPKFNSIEYRKCSVPKFQYYWILKKFQYWSSIVPKISVLFQKIPKFSKNVRNSKKIIQKFEKKIEYFFPNDFFHLILITKFGIFGYCTEMDSIVLRFWYWTFSVFNSIEQYSWYFRYYWIFFGIFYWK